MTILIILLFVGIILTMIDYVLRKNHADTSRMLLVLLLIAIVLIIYYLTGIFR